MKYICKSCGKEHDDIPDVSHDKPYHYWAIPEEERGKRVELTSDTCIIDNEYYLVRGVIEIPIQQTGRVFGWGVWASLKVDHFYRYVETFDNDEWEELGPYFGWLCSKIAYYKEDTLFLKTSVHLRKNGLRPVIQVEPSEHPLARHQYDGISMDEVYEIIHWYSP